ncbi:MAG: VWA domain-containing protein [Candidatus Acidiferrales bacterium]
MIRNRNGSNSLPSRGFLLVVLFLVLMPCPLHAQTPVAPAQQPLRVATDIVKINVSVMGNSGDFIAGLEQKNFRVLDNGTEQPITFFASTDAPAQILVMVETSPAVYLIQNEHLTAAFALVQGLAADDQVALVTYSQEPHAVLAFTADKTALTSSLGQLQYTVGMGQLNFFDSISTALDWIAPLPGKKALVLLTTGLDSSPPARWDALVQKLRAQDVVIFPVALGGSLRRPPLDKKKKPSAPANESALSFQDADRALFALADMTGGNAFFPMTPKDFFPVYHEIAAALRHQYLLGIASAHDGKFHPLSVQVLDDAGQLAPKEGKNSIYRIFARQGYLAPGP